MTARTTHGDGAYGPLLDLRAELHNHSDLSVSCIHVPADRLDRDPAEPADYIRVASGGHGPYRVVWEDPPGTYRWDSGPLAGYSPGGRDHLTDTAATIASLLASPAAN